MLKVLHPSPNLNLKHFRMVEAMGFKTIALQPAILASPLRNVIQIHQSAVTPIGLREPGAIEFRGPLLQK
jgi:hypothetical protein